MNEVNYVYEAIRVYKQWSLSAGPLRSAHKFSLDNYIMAAQRRGYKIYLDNKSNLYIAYTSFKVK